MKMFRHIKVLRNKSRLRFLYDMYMRSSILDMDYWNNFLRVADINITRFITEKTYLKFVYGWDNKDTDPIGFIYLTGLRRNPKPDKKPIIYTMIYIKDRYRHWNYATELLDDAIEYLGGLPDDCIIEFPIRYFSKGIIKTADKFNAKTKSYKKTGIVYVL